MTDTIGLCPVAPSPFAQFPSREVYQTTTNALSVLLIRLIDNYWAFRGLESDICDEVYADKSISQAVDPWMNLSSHAAVEAENQLVLAILAMGSEMGTFPGKEHLNTAMTPRGVLYKGRFYLAIQDPNDLTPLGQKAPEGGNSQTMRIAVVEACNVLAMD